MNSTSTATTDVRFLIPVTGRYYAFSSVCDEILYFIARGVACKYMAFQYIGFSDDCLGGCFFGILRIRHVQFFLKWQYLSCTVFLLLAFLSVPHQFQPLGPVKYKSNSKSKFMVPMQVNVFTMVYSDAHTSPSAVVCRIFLCCSLFMWHFIEMPYYKYPRNQAVKLFSHSWISMQYAIQK